MAQRILLTGASRGLGAALARALAAQGHVLTLVARDEARLNEVAAQCRALGAAAVKAAVHVAALDLSQPQGLLARVEALDAQAGGFDVVINNAGSGHYRSFLAEDEASLRLQTDLHLTAPMLIARAVLPGMLARQRGYFIQVASDIARRPLAQMSPYVAAKHGLLGFSGSLLREFKDQGIRVTTVLPGMIDSDFNGGKTGEKGPRWALQVDELAQEIARLLTLPDHWVIDEWQAHAIGQPL